MFSVNGSPNCFGPRIQVGTDPNKMVSYFDGFVLVLGFRYRNGFK